MISMVQLGWVAGLLEGEGYFGLRRGDKDLRIQVAMTDRDVIDRLHSLFGFGWRKERRLPSGKIAYCWGVSGQANAAGLMMTLLPLMGERRRAKIIECLEAWKAKRFWKQGPTCFKGHPLSGDNLIIAHEGKYEKRRCKECIKLRMRKHRAKKEKPVRAPRILPTHCKHGHELTSVNLRITPDGYRECRECNRSKTRLYRAKQVANE